MHTQKLQNFTSLGKPLNLKLASVILSPTTAFPEIMRSRVNSHGWQEGSQCSPSFCNFFAASTLNPVNLLVNL